MAENNNPGNQNPIAGAITYPSRSDEEAQPLPQQPRQPRNLQGLLRFAMEATKAEDAPGPSNLGPMDEQRRQFLEQALRNLTVDVAEVLQRAIKVLNDPQIIGSIREDDDMPAEVARAFEAITDYVDDIDIANDFYKLGGFSMFPVCFGCKSEIIRTLSYTILGSLCQNNPFCQNRALACGMLNILVKMLETEEENALVKCIFAISCMCRNHELAYQKFMSLDGLTQLINYGLKNEHHNANAKAAFFLRYLYLTYDDVRRQCSKFEIVKMITEHLRVKVGPYYENLFDLLLEMAKEQPTIVMRQLADPKIGLKDVLVKISENEKDKVLNKYCRELLIIIGEGEKLDPIDDCIDR